MLLMVKVGGLVVVVVGEGNPGKDEKTGIQVEEGKAGGEKR